jgi:hypothetical protein
MLQPQTKTASIARRNKTNETSLIFHLILTLTRFCLAISILMVLILSMVLPVVILPLTILVFFGIVPAAFISAVIIPLYLIFHYGSRVRYLAFSSYLRYCFPEEAVADLAAFRKKLMDDKKPSWLIKVKILRQLIMLIWAFYFKIKIDNLWSLFKNQNIGDI